VRKRSPAAKTAFGPMVIAACEQCVPEAHRLILDGLAFRFLPPAMQAMASLCKWSFVRRMLIQAAEKDAPGTWAGIACRKRYIDAKVCDAIRERIKTLVFLGAGLDTRACRLAVPNGVHAYEVDQPTNIDLKRNRVRRLYGRIPEHLTLVPVDFETDDLGAYLAASGFRMEAVTMFIWEGVTQYLTEQAVRKTLAFLSNAGAGSRMVFTYVRKDFLDGARLYGGEKLFQRFVSGGVWRFGIAPEAVGSLLKEYGWMEREQAGSAEFAARYVAPAGRDLPVFEIERCVYAEKI
jgi:methyltransferase (TIGR00027 family)